MNEEAQENPGEEPSMEDILASIRRILSEDEEAAEAAPAAEAAAPAPEPEPAPEEPVDEMAAAMEEMAAEEPAAPEPAPEPVDEMAAAMEEMAAEESASPEIELADTDEPEPEPEPVPVAAAPAPAPAPPPVSAAPPPPPLRPGGEPDISGILDLTQEMITAAPEGGDSLVSGTTYRASTDVLGDLARAILNQRELQVGGEGVTLEGMTREMIRPLLKEWLDQNLPYLIERLVKKEIDRMINRAERLDL